MRQFKLINKYGQEYDLSRKQSFFNNPQGLGRAMQSELLRVGDAFFNNKTEESPPAPSGEIVFCSYAEYDNFLNFIYAGGIILAYKYLQDWQFLNVEILIDKSELNSDTDLLICPVSFIATGFWHKKVSYLTPTSATGESKKYQYTYNYTYGMSENSIFNIDLPLPSYFKLSVFGPCTNPEWRITQNDKIIHSGKLNITITSAHKIIVNTNPPEMEISEYDLQNKFIRSLYPMSDFATERIFELPQGQSRLIVLDQGITSPKAFMEVRKRV